MAWFDIVLILVFIMHLVSGFSRGLIKQLFDILGFILVIFLSLWGSRNFSHVLVEYINPEDIIPHHDVITALGVDVALEQAPQLIAGILTFLILFLILSMVFKLFSSGFRWINRIPVIGLFNRIGGGVLGSIVGLVFVYIIIAAFSLIPLQFFMDALEESEVVFVADYYITPAAEELKDQFIEYYLTINGK